MDSVTEYELWKAIWSSLKEEFLLSSNGRWAATTLPDSFVPVTFVGNHDVTHRLQVGPGQGGSGAGGADDRRRRPVDYYGDEQATPA